MSDPMQEPKAKKAPAPPANAAEAEQQALQANQFQSFIAQRTGRPTAILPGGRKIDATPHINARYNSRNQSKLWGAEEKIVKAEWRAQHPGWRFAWPTKTAYTTQAYINSGRYKTVPYSAIEKNEFAMVASSPEGDTVWMQHILVAMSPEVWNEEMVAPENESIARTAMNRATVEAEINKQFGSYGYKGEASISDVRQER